MRLLFLGNSHIAALRDAWRAQPQRWPGIEAEFFGAHQDLLLRTSLRDGVLTPLDGEARTAFDKINGRTEQALNGFDHIIVTGGMVALPQIITTYREARWFGLPSLAVGEGAELPLLSRPAVEATVAATIARRLGPELVRRLVRVVQGPIWLTSQPRVSTRIRELRPKSTRTLRAAMAAGDGAELSRMFDAAAARALAEAGGRFLPQPQETIEDHVLTALPYTLGATRLAAREGVPQPVEDIMHANAAYGALVLDQVIAAARGA